MAKSCLDHQVMEEEFHSFIIKCRDAMNEEHDYDSAYDYAVQAKYIADFILGNPEYIFESELLRGLAKLGIDRLSGHELLNKLYEESQNLIKGNLDLEIRITKALGTAKIYIGEYDEALSFFTFSLKLSQRQVERTYQNGEDPLDDIIRMIRNLIHISITLIHKNRQKNYPLVMKNMENKLSQIGLDNLDAVKSEMKKVSLALSYNNELEEALKHINEALRMSKEHDLKELELTCLLNKANILNEKGNYTEALQILEGLQNEEYIINHALGYVLNESGIAYVNIGKLDLGFNLLQKAWTWLAKKKDLDELSRNIIGTGLYYYKKGKLETAYAFAEMAYSRDFDICSLKLLYDITLLKYIQARRQGNESEYVFYRSEYEKYKQQLERRG